MELLYAPYSSLCGKPRAAVNFGTLSLKRIQCAYFQGSVATVLGCGGQNHS